MPDSRSDKRPCNLWKSSSWRRPEQPASTRFAAIDHTAPKHGLADRAREIAECPHQPETDGGVGDGVMADLLESEIKQAVETDPRYGEAQDMRRVKKVAGRRGTSRPSDQNDGELIDAADRCRGIVGLLENFSRWPLSRPRILDQRRSWNVSATGCRIMPRKMARATRQHPDPAATRRAPNSARPYRGPRAAAMDDKSIFILTFAGRSAYSRRLYGSRPTSPNRFPEEPSKRN